MENNPENQELGQSQELDLEAIMREFSDHSEDETDPEIQEEAPLAQEYAEESTADFSVEDVPEALTADTVTLEFGAIQQEEQVPVQEPVAVPAEESATTQWMPEYVQPESTIVPPQPVLVHPQSRLKELKKKLVNGPEKRYYQLSEKGTGKLHILIFLAAIISLLCIGSTVLYEMDKVQPNRIRLMVFGQIWLMFFSALLGSFQLIEGVSDLFRRRFSLNTLLVFSFILCCADGVMCLQELRVPCCGAFSLQVCMSLLDTLYMRRREARQMDTLRKATNLTALRVSDAKADGNHVIVRSEGQVEDFMDHYSIPTKPEKIRSVYALCALGAAIAVGAAAGIINGISASLQAASVALLAAIPASFFISLSRPADILERRFNKIGTLLCGWDGISRLRKNLLFPLSHKDLFPAGTVKMNGVKFFGSRSPDEVVAYCAALISADGSGLVPLFDQLLESRNCHHLSTQNFVRYDGGIGGEVRSEPVLVGSLHFLQEMGVEIPQGLRVSQAICVSVDGVLSGLFAISYERTRAASDGFATLTSYKGVQCALVDSDLLLTHGYLRHKFSVNTKRMSVLDEELCKDIVELQGDTTMPVSVLTTQSDLTAVGFGVTGGRTLGIASYLGLIVHIIGGIIGVATILFLAISGNMQLLTPLNVLLYQLFWSIPGLILTEWTRLI